MDGDLRLRMREVACGYCQAAPGKPCRTLKGRVLQIPHTKRVNAWYLKHEHAYGGGVAQA
jgi:hypothetical protein